jgi:hypothetical protein
MFWRKKPPVPIYKRQPVLILTLVAMFVLGPVGVIWNGLTEEMKGMKLEDKENKGAIIQNQLAIKELLTRQQMILAPRELKIKNPEAIQGKKPVPPDYFQAYLKLAQENKVGYKIYLDQLGYDTRGLP